MRGTRKILIMGASYGSLLAIKLVAAGHQVKLACLASEADLINKEGIRVRIPAKGNNELIDVDSRYQPGQLSAAVPAEIDPSAFDLVVLAMQEPQYGSPGVRELLDAVAKAKVPSMSIMNMPPPPYLARIPDVSVDACRDCYTEPAVWENFRPALMTLCSPDPQAFRPPDESVNVLQVRLPTNFKAAPFESAAHTDMLRQLESGIEAARFETGHGRIELPVKLRVHDSIFVPLAKWSMLIAGNYRCVQKGGVRSIKDAVHTDIEASRAIYDWVSDLCKALGAAADDLVPFAKYANAAQSLASPSSAARALANGAHNIERVDRLVQALAQQKGMQSNAVDEIVALVDERLQVNRSSNFTARSQA